MKKLLGILVLFLILCNPVFAAKEKPLVKKQLSIWSLDELKKIIYEINKTELLCKKNPQISEFIFFKLFSKVCLEANSSS